MKGVKLMSFFLGGHFKLGKKSLPTSNDEQNKMVTISYLSIVGSLMFVMVYTR